MRLMAGCFAIAVAVTASQANAAPWCAFYDASTYNCGFYSYEQCRATTSGAGGACRPNFFEPREAPRRPESRSRRSNR